MLLHVIAAQFHRVDVGGNQLFFLLEFIGNDAFEYLKIHVQQHRQGAYVDHVFEQLAQAWIAVFAQTNFHHRNADVGDVFPHEFRMQDFSAVVHKIPP